MESVNTNTTMKQEALKPVGILERPKQGNTGPLDPNVVIQPLRKKTQPLDPNIQIPNLAKKPQPEPLEVFAEGQSKADQLAAARKVADTLQQQKIQKDSLQMEWKSNEKDKSHAKAVRAFRILGRNAVRLTRNVFDPFTIAKNFKAKSSGTRAQLEEQVALFMTSHDGQVPQRLEDLPKLTKNLKKQGRKAYNNLREEAKRQDPLQQGVTSLATLAENNTVAEHLGNTINKMLDPLVDQLKTIKPEERARFLYEKTQAIQSEMFTLAANIEQAKLSGDEQAAQVHDLMQSRGISAYVLAKAVITSADLVAQNETQIGPEAIAYNRQRIDLQLSKTNTPQESTKFAHELREELFHGTLRVFGKALTAAEFAATWGKSATALATSAVALGALTGVVTSTTGVPLAIAGGVAVSANVLAGVGRSIANATEDIAKAEVMRAEGKAKNLKQNETRYSSGELTNAKKKTTLKGKILHGAVELAKKPTRAHQREVIATNEKAMRHMISQETFLGTRSFDPAQEQLERPAHRSAEQVVKDQIAEDRVLGRITMDGVKESIQNAKNLEDFNIALSRIGDGLACLRLQKEFSGKRIFIEGNSSQVLRQVMELKELVDARSQELGISQQEINSTQDNFINGWKQSKIIDLKKDRISNLRHIVKRAATTAALRAGAVGGAVKVVEHLLPHADVVGQSLIDTHHGSQHVSADHTQQLFSSTDTGKHGGYTATYKPGTNTSSEVVHTKDYEPLYSHVNAAHNSQDISSNFPETPHTASTSPSFDIVKNADGTFLEQWTVGHTALARLWRVEQHNGSYQFFRTDKFHHGPVTYFDTTEQKSKIVTTKDLDQFIKDETSLQELDPTISLPKGESFYIPGLSDTVIQVDTSKFPGLKIHFGDMQKNGRVPVSLEYKGKTINGFLGKNPDDSKINLYDSSGNPLLALSKGDALSPVAISEFAKTYETPNVNIHDSTQFPDIGNHVRTQDYMQVNTKPDDWKTIEDKITALSGNGKTYQGMKVLDTRDGGHIFVAMDGGQTPDGAVSFTGPVTIYTADGPKVITGHEAQELFRTYNFHDVAGRLDKNNRVIEAIPMTKSTSWEEQTGQHAQANAADVKTTEADFTKLLDEHPTTTVNLNGHGFKDTQLTITANEPNVASYSVVTDSQGHLNLVQTLKGNSVQPVANDLRYSSDDQRLYYTDLHGITEVINEPKNIDLSHLTIPKSEFEKINPFFHDKSIRMKATPPEGNSHEYAVTYNDGNIFQIYDVDETGKGIEVAYGGNVYSYGEQTFFSYILKGDGATKIITLNSNRQFVINPSDLDIPGTGQVITPTPGSTPTVGNTPSPDVTPTAENFTGLNTNSLQVLHTQVGNSPAIVELPNGALSGYRLVENSHNNYTILLPQGVSGILRIHGTYDAAHDYIVFTKDGNKYYAKPILENVGSEEQKVYIIPAELVSSSQTHDNNFSIPFPSIPIPSIPIGNIAKGALGIGVVGASGALGFTGGRMVRAGVDSTSNGRKIPLIGGGIALGTNGFGVGYLLNPFGYAAGPLGFAAGYFFEDMRDWRRHGNRHQRRPQAPTPRRVPPGPNNQPEQNGQGNINNRANLSPVPPQPIPPVIPRTNNGGQPRSAFNLQLPTGLRPQDRTRAAAAVPTQHARPATSTLPNRSNGGASHLDTDNLDLEDIKLPENL